MTCGGVLGGVVLKNGTFWVISIFLKKIIEVLYYSVLILTGG